MLGDFLYQLTLRDEQVSLLDFFSVNLVKAENNTAIQLSQRIEEGRILLLQSAWIEASSVALTSRVNACDLSLVNPEQTQAFNLFAVRSDSNAGVQTLGNDPLLNTGLGAKTGGNFQPPFLIIPPRWLLRVNANFSVAAPNNLVRMHLVGLSIPKGNLLV